MKPTRRKVFVSLLLAIPIFLAYEIISGLFGPIHINFIGNLCFYKYPLSFIAPNSSLFSEWAVAGHIRCGPQSQVQEIFFEY